MDQSLLCDETWTLSPSPSSRPSKNAKKSQDGDGSSPSPFFHCMTGEDCDEAVAICLEKEMSYMPEPGYANDLEAKGLVAARFRIMQRFAKSQSRLELDHGTIFLAANYFDRFVSTCKCQEWKHWIFELLSIACLSIASKFSETLHTLPLQEIQMQDLDHSFELSTIRRMELLLLQKLGWRVGSVTAHSYVELFTWNGEISTSHLREQFSSKVNELLVHSLMDVNFLKFRPSVVAASALKCGLNDVFRSLSATHLTKYICTICKYDKKEEDLMKCHDLMEAWLIDQSFNSSTCRHSSYCISSPDTVLLSEQIDMNDNHVDLSILKKRADTIKCNKGKRRKKERQLTDTI